MFQVQIIEDSEFNGSRLTTFLVTYPRMIHSELLTHRLFSRNSSSSRAIPLKRLLKSTLEDPATPIAFLENQPGMQPAGKLPPFKHFLAELVWSAHRYVSVACSYLLGKLNVHKQYANRLYEPHQHITVVITGCQGAYYNFFALRDHPMAQAEIQELAATMRDLYECSHPWKLAKGDWHLPFVSPDERLDSSIDWTKVSAARCARTSYYTHEGKKPSTEEDLKLFDRLTGSVPKHSSPLEHQACAGIADGLNGNLDPCWVQFRKTIENEYIDDEEKLNKIQK